MPIYTEQNVLHLRGTDWRVWLTDQHSADTAVLMAISSVILTGNEIRTHMAITHYLISRLTI